MYSSMSLPYPRRVRPQMGVVYTADMVTSNAFSVDYASSQALQPANIGLSLFEDNGMSFLQDFMDGDESLEGLDLVGEDGLTVNGGSEPKGSFDEAGRIHFHASPKGLGGLVVPCVDDAASNMFS
jgi:hypothetical protein